jgi:NAD(P)-dependent dehydrogenase (short-subunit alcohol dehydrogenase family)
MDLSARGFRVFAGVRQAADADRFEEEDLEQLRPIMLDVTDPAMIESAAEEVAGATGGRGIFGLVNNAGVAVFGPVEQTSMTAVDQQLRVNLVGAIAVTQRFLPQLREGKGRIVNISSVNGKLSIPFSGVYSASKFALEAISDALRVELEPWGIGVSVVEPGAVSTEIRNVAMQGWVEHRGGLAAAERELYEDVYQKTQSIIDSLQENGLAFQRRREKPSGDAGTSGNLSPMRGRPLQTLARRRPKD